jgi:hypothetical protein
MTKLIAYARGNAIAIAALFLALSGGYAIAATTSTKTISACANKKTGELFLHGRSGCKRGQSKVTWNQQGPQGKQGATGAAASTAFGQVDSDGVVMWGQGVTVQHAGTGDYAVTITAAGCATGANVPTITPTSSYSPTAPPPPATSTPDAWIEDNGTNEQFTVRTGYLSGGSLAPIDDRFEIQVACKLSGSTR